MYENSGKGHEKATIPPWGHPEEFPPRDPSLKSFLDD